MVFRVQFQICWSWPVLNEQPINVGNSEKLTVNNALISTYLADKW